MFKLVNTIVLAAVFITLSTADANAFSCTPSAETEMFVDAMQEMTTAYQNTALQLSSDIGTMADRIVYTEELIGDMADRIVTTEALMAQLTLMLVQIAAGQDIDPALLQSIQDNVINTCGTTVQ